MSVAATFRVPTTVVCFGLVLAPTFSVSQNLAQIEADIAGLWSHVSEASGAHLLIRFAFRPDGTYQYYMAYNFGGACNGLYYQGEFRIAGGTIQFFPISANEGCSGNERPLGREDLAAQKPDLGNWRSNLSFQGNSCVSDFKIVSMEKGPAFQENSGLHNWSLYGTLLFVSVT